jgi:hypothetical protein
LRRDERGERREERGERREGRGEREQAYSGGNSTPVMGYG